MKVIIKQVRIDSEKIIRAMKFNVIAENHQESAIDILQELLSLLEQNALNSYSITFMVNNYEHLDIQINCFFSQIWSLSIDGNQTNVLLVDFDQKIDRLFHYFYDKSNLIGLLLDYNRFKNFLTRYHYPYSPWSNEQLFSMPQFWNGLSKVYEIETFKHNIEKDKYYKILKHQENSNHYLKTFPSTCPFDSAKSLEQVIYHNEFFRVSVNHMPIGNTRLHFMVIPNQHTADLTVATKRQLFELELMLKTMIDLISCNVGSPRQAVKVLLQKHAAGMTVNHSHIHVLFPPSKGLFRADIIQQMRFIACQLSKLPKIKKYTKEPISQERVSEIKATFLPGISALIAKNWTTLLQSKIVFPCYPIANKDQEVDSESKITIIPS